MSLDFKFHITDREAGQRLDEFLASRLGSLSRMQIAKLLARRACLVNQNPELGGYKLYSGNVVEITLADFEQNSMSAERLPLEIVFEDSHILVIVKPAGMLVHPNKIERTGTLANALAYHLNREFFADADPEKSLLVQDGSYSLQRPGLVHRLDRATSGLIVVARTQRALSVLSRHFHRRLVEKRYFGIVSGEMKEESGTILAPIGRDPQRRPQWWVVESGRQAETKYRVLENRGFASLVEMEPVTGRTNQLRIHFAHIGHPIIGDPLYSSGKSGQSDQNTSTSLRLCLHAAYLAFHHPANGEWLEFHSALPVEIKAVLTG